MVGQYRGFPGGAPGRREHELEIQSRLPGRREHELESKVAFPAARNTSCKSKVAFPAARNTIYRGPAKWVAPPPAPSGPGPGAALRWVLPRAREVGGTSSGPPGYRQTPTTAGKVRSADRRLAIQLYQQGVPIALVEAAFALAAVRRIFRPPERPPLAPIHSLQYFLSVMKEIRDCAIPPGYIQHQQWKLENLHLYGKWIEVPAG